MTDSGECDVKQGNIVEVKDHLFPIWEHLLTKTNRRVGLYEAIGLSDQNTTIPRDFRNCLGVNHTLELRIDIFRSYLEENIRSQWPSSILKSDIQNAIQEYNLKVAGIGSTFSDENISKYACKSPETAKNSETSDPIVLIGAITKRQRFHPNEIDHVCKKIGVLNLPTQRECFGDENKNSMFLMDRTSRIQLRVLNKDIPGEIISGIVCAVKGYLDQRCLVVQNIIFPTPKEPIWPQVTKFHNIEMVFISGLHIGKIVDDFVHRNLLLEYLQGLTGCPAEQEHIVRRRARAFIVGNSFVRNRKPTGNSTSNLANQAENAKLVDDFISQLCDTMEVFVLPGENDPTCTPLLPQPPIHAMILPKSSQHRNFRKLSNPANIKVSVTSALSTTTEPLNSIKEEESVHLVLSSGKNVTDAMNFCNIKCPLKMAKKLLEWSHIHPTSQQVIPLNAGNSENFFSLKGTLPHMFVLGNQKTFEVESWNGVKIISVPDFDRTSTLVLLNFELDVVPMTFKFAV